MGDFETELATVAARVERALEGRLAALAGVPERLASAMRHAALGGGKRLRPFLLIETARLFGAEPERALSAALALECVHCYSLVHDDLPAMDDDDTRRGQPTVHRAYDEATAILAGDALLTLAFELLGDEATDPDPAIRARLVVELARTAGAAGMVGGQMLDLAAEGRYAPDRAPLDLSLDDILHLQGMKTGALFRFALRAGAIMGRASEAEAAALDLYARRLGQAFQLADDLLDARGDAARLGKAAGKDAARGKATLVGQLGIEGARVRLSTMIEEGRAALLPFGARARLLDAALRFTAEREV